MRLPFPVLGDVTGMWPSCFGPRRLGELVPYRVRDWDYCSMIGKIIWFIMINKSRGI